VCSLSSDPDDCVQPFVTTDKTPTFNGTTDIIAECFISDDNTTWAGATTTNATGHIWTLPSTQALSDGLSSVYAMCNSTANLKGYDEWKMNITDIVNPNVTIINPPDNHNISLAPYSITFNATITDDGALDNVSLLLGGFYNFTNSTGLINGSYTLPFTFSERRSEYNWSVEACDTSGNCNASSNRTLYTWEETYLEGNVTDSDDNLLSGALLSIMKNNTPNTVVANVTTNSTGGWRVLVDYGLYTICAYDPNNITLRGDCTPFVEVS